MNNLISKLKELHVPREVTFPFIVTFALSVFMPSLAHTKPQEIKLIEKVEVRGQLVRLSDLFENVGLAGSTAVFRAPNPGTTGKVSVKRILSAAKAQGLKVYHLPSFQMVTITRSSRMIELSELKDLIRSRVEDRLSANNTNGQLVIKLPENLKELHVDPSVQGELTLSSFDWSARSGRFTARFTFADGKPIVLRGSVSLMIEVAVAKTIIKSGETLSQSDIEMKLVKWSRRSSNNQSSMDEMVGLAAKRRLQAGKPIRMSDLEPARLIHKNQLVTILLEVPGLVLRTEGKALSDASQGESVKVLNTQSKRIINATARSSGLVSVRLFGSSESGS